MTTFKYRVLAVMGLALPPATAVKLTPEQLKTRAHQVRLVEGQDGFYVSDRDTLQFKRGELVELAAALPKGQIVNGFVDQLDAAEQPVPPPAPSKPTPAPGQTGRRGGRAAK